jgi:hypothetical protein
VRREGPAAENAGLGMEANEILKRCMTQIQTLEGSSIVTFKTFFGRTTELLCHRTAALGSFLINVGTNSSKKPTHRSLSPIFPTNVERLRVVLKDGVPKHKF